MDITDSPPSAGFSLSVIECAHCNWIIDMSRSRNKTPVHRWTCAESESADKRLWHKRLRARERDRLITDPESEPTHQNEVSSTWDMAKDGKHYWADMRPEDMRK